MTHRLLRDYVQINYYKTEREEGGIYPSTGPATSKKKIVQESRMSVFFQAGGQLLNCLKLTYLTWSHPLFLVTVESGFLVHNYGTVG